MNDQFETGLVWWKARAADYQQEEASRPSCSSCRLRTPSETTVEDADEVRRYALQIIGVAFLPPLNLISRLHDFFHRNCVDIEEKELRLLLLQFN